MNSTKMELFRIYRIDAQVIEVLRLFLQSTLVFINLLKEKSGCLIKISQDKNIQNILILIG